MSAPLSDGFWPGDRHGLLLHACLDPVENAVGAWDRWRELVQFDDVDGPELRLLPLAYRNLGEEIRGDPVHGRAAGLYRRTWTQNQLLFDRAAGPIAALREAGIDVMLLKGAPLCILHYGSAGARPMADVDMLVRPAEAERAMGVLRKAGWRPDQEPAEKQIRIHHSYGFRDDAMGHVDLHWFSLWQSSSDGPIWPAARQIEIAGAEALAPCATDLLLVVCAHGSPRQPEPAFRWIADAVTICRSGDVDWERLCREARRRNLTVAAAAALAYMRAEFGVDVPGDALADLDPAAAPRWEREAYRKQGSPAGPLRTLRLLRERHRRMTMLREEAPWHPGFLRYAGSIWGFDHAWQLPAYGARRMARSLAARLSPPGRGARPVR